MEIPMKGDTIVRTTDGARFTIAEVVQAGGENLYRMDDGTEVSEALFLKEHDEERPTYEVAR